jgi:tetratricopeptide (TPR) repeat protein
MAGQETKRYLELQMEELKAAHAVNAEDAPKNMTNNRSKNAEIAKLYEDAAEYEEDLACFEKELEIVNAHPLKDIAASLIQKFPNEERDYAHELKTVLEMGWTHLVHVAKTHPPEQLELIKETDFCDVIEKLSAAYPDYHGDFESEVRDILLKRWEMLIAIKKDHIKEELAEIKIMGLKPNYVKRIYKEFHGLQ